MSDDGERKYRKCPISKRTGIPKPLRALLANDEDVYDDDSVDGIVHYWALQEEAKGIVNFLMKQGHTEEWLIERVVVLRDAALLLERHYRGKFSHGATGTQIEPTKDSNQPGGGPAETPSVSTIDPNPLPADQQPPPGNLNGDKPPWH